MPLDDPSPSRVLLDIAAALPPVERTYALARFLILRMKLLAVMDLLLPAEGQLLDVGCGFGLFAAYFTAMHPTRRVIGVDPSSRRIELAQRVASRMEQSTRFLNGDIGEIEIPSPLEGIYVLDVLHHIAREHQRDVLRKLVDALAPGGVLVIKDITTEPASGRRFTELLDRAVVGFDAPLAYRHHDEWRAMLIEMGLRVRVVRVPDVLPYPHVVLAATRALDEHRA
ncbi:MAG: class I SAM-dependent methyltransferase, partial [Polyangiaceae bacterium]